MALPLAGAPETVKLEIWLPMRFRGTAVWVRCDPAGTPIVDGGRVEMRYKRDGGKVYRGAALNLAGARPGEPKDPAMAPSEASRVSLDPPSELQTVDAEGVDVVAYADGACSGNPGPAGLGVLVLVGRREIEYREPLGKATNNVGELMAILRALQIVRGRPGSLLVRTDSEYSIGVLTRPWKPKRNQEVIAHIKETMTRQPADLKYVAGHAGEPGNERADALAREAIGLAAPRQTETSARRTKR